jgi:hypothetical protein
VDPGRRDLAGAGPLRLRPGGRDLRWCLRGGLGAGPDPQASAASASSAEKQDREHSAAQASTRTGHLLIPSAPRFPCFRRDYRRRLRSGKVTRIREREASHSPNGLAILLERVEPSGPWRRTRQMSQVQPSATSKKHEPAPN